jgi:hypothetical protein
MLSPIKVAIEQCGIALHPFRDFTRHAAGRTGSKLDQDPRPVAVLDGNLLGADHGQLLKGQRMLWIRDAPDQVYSPGSEAQTRQACERTEDFIGVQRLVLVRVACIGCVPERVARGEDVRVLAAGGQVHRRVGVVQSATRHFAEWSEVAKSAFWLSC